MLCIAVLIPGLGSGSVLLCAQPVKIEDSNVVANADGMQVNGEIRLYEALLLPGRQQLRSGSKTKGTLLASSAFLSVLTLGGAQWLYARQTEQAAYFQTEYTQLAGTLNPLREYVDGRGYVTEWSLYQDWKNAYRDANRMKRVRNYVFIGTAAIYLLNSADVLRARRRNMRLSPSLTCEEHLGGCAVGGRLVF